MLVRIPADRLRPQQTCDAADVADLEALRDRMRQFTADRDWSRFHDPKSVILALVGEVGELAELFQWLPAEEARNLAGHEPLKTRAGEEMADVLLYLVLLADVLGIDLAAAAHAKMDDSGVCQSALSGPNPSRSGHALPDAAYDGANCRNPRREGSPPVPGSPDRSLAPDQPESGDTPQQLPTALSRPDAQLHSSDAARFVDRPADPDRPAAWSRAGLQHRLERLPPSHPSSLHGADHHPDLRREAGPDRTERSFWSELPRFMQAWTEHLRRWPDDRPTATTVDRSRDPDGSWRGDGNQYLNPDQHAQAKEVIAEVQQAERSLTEDITTAAQGEHLRRLASRSGTPAQGRRTP